MITAIKSLIFFVLIAVKGTSSMAYEGKRYAVQLNSSWKAEVGLFGSDVIYYGPVSNRQDPPTLYLKSYDVALSQEDASAFLDKQLKKMDRDQSKKKFRILSQGKLQTLRFPAYFAEVEFEGTNGAKQKQFSLLIPRNKFYVFALFSARSDDYAAHIKAVQSSLKKISFKI